MNRLASMILVIVALAMAHGPARAGGSLFGTTWRAVAIDNAPALDAVPTRLLIEADGSFRSFVGCNQLTGIASVSYQRLTFELLASTGKACPSPASLQEQNYVAALDATRSFAIDGDVLKFYDAAGTPLVSFATDPPH